MSQSLRIRRNEDGQDALKPKGSTLRTAFRQKDESAPSSAGTAYVYDPLLALKTALDSLDDSKAENIVSIDIRGKSSLGDYLVIASGRSHRHVAAIADQLIQAVKDKAKGDGRDPKLRVEGLQSADWVLVDTGDLIVHIFRPEVREFYNIEKMWQTPELDNTHH